MAQHFAPRAVSCRRLREVSDVGLCHSEVDVRDAAGFETYRTIAAKAIAQYGGRYLVRGGAAGIAEGGPPPKNIIVVEFPSMEKLRQWYASA